MCNKDCFHCQFADCISEDTDYTDVKDVEKALQVYIEWQRNTNKENSSKKSLKERQKRYEQTDKAKDRMYKYNHSKKGIARRKRQDKKRKKLTPKQIYNRQYYLRKKLEKAEV